MVALKKFALWLTAFPKKLIVKLGISIRPSLTPEFAPVEVGLKLLFRPGCTILAFAFGPAAGAAGPGPGPAAAGAAGAGAGAGATGAGAAPAFEASFRQRSRFSFQISVGPFFELFAGGVGWWRALYSLCLKSFLRDGSTRNSLVAL